MNKKPEELSSDMLSRFHNYNKLNYVAKGNARKELQIRTHTFYNQICFRGE